MASQRSRAPETGDLFAPREGAGVRAAGEGKASIARDAAEARAEAPAREGSDRQDRLDRLDHPDVPDRPDWADAPPSPSPSPRADAPGEPAPAFEYNGGVHLTDSILWCDADRRHDLCFVSHAHADCVGKNRRLLATDKTIKIMTRGTARAEALTSPYRRSFTLGPLTLEMHPAGHILGSAQLLIVRNQRRLVYTSDVNTRATFTAERARPVPCDTLVIPATYGLPSYRFPAREEVYADIRAFVERCLEDRATPVLIANLVGTAQELMWLLGEAGLRLRVHRSIYDVAKVYRELGVNLPTSRRFAGTPARDEVVIFPPILRKHASIRKLRKFQTAMVSGHAVDEGFAFRHRVDRAFCLSDTVDHDELLAFIAETGASEVFLSSGHVEAVAETLRSRGLRAYPLVPPRQLSLF